MLERRLPHPVVAPVLYLRVSTIDQTTANQERELRDIAGRMGYEIVKVYKDHGISGAGRSELRHPCQTVRVEHVHVNEGGQALIGNVNSIPGSGR
jgi:Resolvase, N terminal domain